MLSKQTYKTPAIILSTIDYGESDKIVSFYSADFGKIKGIAKGAKNSRKRFANVLEPFTQVSLIFSQRRTGMLAFIESCIAINHYGKIRSNLQATLIASYFVELTDHFTMEGKASVKLFTLLSQFLSLLGCENVNSEKLARFFEIRLLKIMGYEPSLDKCIQCNRAIEEGTSLQFDHKGGGVRCSLCRVEDSTMIICSVGALKTIIKGKEIEIEIIDRILFSQTIATECEKIMSVFIRHILGRELRSKEVMRQIANLKATDC